MLDHYCPNCGASHPAWYFERGYSEPGGGQIEPDYGNCSSCGFQYHQHCKHGLKEQLEKFQNKAGEKMEAKHDPPRQKNNH